MARSSKHGLSVWMNGELVGHWTIGSGGHQFTYEPNWLTSPSRRPLSLSLPFTPGNLPAKGTAVENYFENLLPDRSEIRNRLRDRFRAASTRAFDLLAEVGRDCVGAVQLVQEGSLPPEVRTITSEPLSEAQIEKDLMQAGGLLLPDLDEDGFRLSLAGAQEKTAFLLRNGTWHRPLGSTPTTHIFKLPLGQVAGRAGFGEWSLENEWLCSRILREYGFEVAPSSIARFGSQKVLVVERFDRKLASDGTWWQRVPTEDLCQAKGVAPEKKYESDGGPGITDVLQVLQGSETSQRDREDFFRAQIAFWLLCAPDGHAKNFSLFLGPENRYRLTPLYDVISAYPWIGTSGNQIPLQKLRMAMAVRGRNSHYHWSQIHRDHWDATAKFNGLGPDAGRFVADLVTKTPKVLQAVNAQLPFGFPGEVADRVLEGLSSSTDRLDQMRG